MYANRPQFTAPPQRSGYIPIQLGTTDRGWGPVGEALGKGLGDFVQKSYLDPLAEAKKNTLRMESDPAVQHDMMMKAYQLFSDPTMPQSLRDNIAQNPGFQSRLSKWQGMFAGMAPIIQDPTTGALSFAPRVGTLEQQKAGAIAEGTGATQSGPEELGEAGRDVSSSTMPSTRQLLFSKELEDLAKTDYYKEHAKVLPSEAVKNEAMAGKTIAETAQVKPLAESQIALQTAQGESLTTRAEKTESPEEKAQRELARANTLEANKLKLEWTRQDAKDARTLRDSQDKEMRDAETALRKALRDRTQAISTGKAVDSIKGAVRDVYSIVDFLDQTGHLPFYEEVADAKTSKTVVRMSHYGMKQVNYAHNAIDRLARSFELAVKARESDELLESIRSTAEAIYDRFNVKRGERSTNLLDDVPTLKAMDKIRRPITLRTGTKDVIIPNDMGSINRWLTEKTGRYIGW